MIKPLPAQLVSRRLRAAGHQLVFPDRKRDGVSVSQAGTYGVTVRASYCVPLPDMPELLGELVTSLTRLGYAIKLEYSGSLEYASILVTRPESTE
jgi:hypothetical protein